MAVCLGDAFRAGAGILKTRAECGTRTSFGWLSSRHLYWLCTRPWALLSAGFHDLRQPPAGNRPSLDVLRSLAVSLVFVYHLQGYAQHARLTLETPFVQFGWAGVDLFFILSGVLIGGQLWKELKTSGTVDVRRFILRRGFRIWPFYYFVVFFLLFEHLFLGRPRPGLWFDATFLSNYFPTHHQIAGGWSLSTEEQFYLLIPVLLMIAAKFFPPRSLLSLVLVWLFVLPLIRHFALRALHDPAQIHNSIYYAFHTHSDGLAMGLLISWIMTWKPELLLIRRWLDAVLALLFLASFSLWYVASLTFLYSLVALSFGALTFLLLRVPFPFIFRSRVFYAISRLSYGVYLLHAGFLPRVMPYHTHLFGEAFPSFFLAFFVWGTVTLALAFVTFSFIELPFLKLRERFLAKNRTANPGPRGEFTVTSSGAS
jgi:peptidoglycan/LPS O-acetylase OafA/YrhL